MTHDARVDPWRAQSAVTQVGPAGPAIEALPGGLAALRAASRQLVAHYMFGGDEAGSPVTGPRLAEVDTRYADAMFAGLLSRGAPSLDRERPFGERTVGCCRDFAVLFVAMARHRGIPARIRVGYATYFQPRWHVDHVIAEVWDRDAARWRLVEPEIGDGFAPADGPAFDPLDVPPDRFVTGPRAWLAARSGRLDPERCVVTPELEVPYTRGWLSLRHHVVQDLAALNGAEMLLWDEWGMLREDDPLREATLLDELAAALADPACPAAQLATWGRQDGLRVPRAVTSYSPAHPGPSEVDVSRVLAGMIEA